LEKEYEHGRNERGTSKDNPESIVRVATKGKRYIHAEKTGY
jgi:hypothetical protein